VVDEGQEVVDEGQTSTALDIGRQSMMTQLSSSVFPTINLCTTPVRLNTSVEKYMV